MKRCAGCDGILGQDCWNESDCMWIAQQQTQKQESQRDSELWAEIASLKERCLWLEKQLNVLKVK